MIVPYPLSQTRGNSAEDVAKRTFNKTHSSARMTIERAFGTLASRWRFISKHLYMRKTEDICMVIVAACILHNFCINIGDPDFEAEPIIEEVDGDINDGNDNTRFTAGQSRRNQLNRWLS